MASLSLPPPRKDAPVSSLAYLDSSSSDDESDQEREEQQPQTPQEPTTATAKNTKTPNTHPSYEKRCSAAAEASKMTAQERQNSGVKLFVPRSLADFGDGGAFPEIHVAQYPRHMGNPHRQSKASSTAGGGSSNTGSNSNTAASTSRALVNVQVDKDGEISYDAIVKGGTNQDKIVYSRLDDIRQKKASPEDLALPTREQEQAEAAKTAAALQALVNPPKKDAQQQPKFISYTANPSAPGYNPAAAQRVIQMHEAKVDPLMPPKHKHVKAPRGPAEDPVPVLHAPPTKLSKEERNAWNVPSCISNWKNMRGYTIPLDKRLAADGRGLQEHTINEKFGTLSESLYVAERQARQEVRLRATVQKKLALQQKEEREEELRQLAQQARMERGGGAASAAAGVVVEEAASSDDDHDTKPSGKNHPIDHNAAESEDAVAARQREQMRAERKRQRERELRQENNAALKKKKLEQERDVSEKIALGVHVGTGGGGGDDVDARLYNQSAGLDSGFGADDEYNTYTKPLFERGAASSSIYRPTRGDTANNADEQYDQLAKGATTRFKADKGFAGAQGGVMDAGPRNAPVQFEKKT